MKLIIDIPEARYKDMQRIAEVQLERNHFKTAEQIIAKGIPLEQEPKTGHWIKIQSGDRDFPESIVCSRCYNANSHLDFDEHCEPIGKIFVTSKYCPNCGAKMESEDKE